MPTDAVETAAETAIGVSAVVWMTLILFWIVSPIAGFYLFKLTRNKLPSSSILALAALAFCGFLVVFAVTLLALLQFAGLDPQLALPVSAISAVIVTGVCALAAQRLLTRSKARASAQADEYAFRVWDEDARAKPKNLRRKRY